MAGAGGSSLGVQTDAGTISFGAASRYGGDYATTVNGIGGLSGRARRLQNGFTRSYALAARAMHEQGESLPFMDGYLAEVLQRYVHGLTPDDRMFVGGDTGDDTPALAPSALVLNAVIAGNVAESVRAQARGELARLDLPGARDEAREVSALFAPIRVDRWEENRLT